MHDALPAQAVAAVLGYRIERLIGAGGMGAVYEARALGPSGPGERVACKVMHEERPGEAARAAEAARRKARRRERVRQEAVLGLRITAGHRGLVRVLDYFDDALGPMARRCIVMELVDGANVAELHGPDHRLPFPVTRRIACEVLDALVYLHGQGVLHRDLSPRNILVSASGAVKVTDLGLARVMEQGQAHTRNFCGVAVYASPEALKGEKLDVRSDLFTLGAVLFELVTGTPPCGEPEQEATSILHMVQGLYVPLPPDTPSDLAELITGLLRTAPDERWPQTAREALSLLRDHGQPLASAAALAALVASARQQHEAEVVARAIVRPADVLAPGHVLAPGQAPDAPMPDVPAQASEDRIRLRLRDPRRVTPRRAAGVAAIAACVLGLGVVSHERLRDEQGASLRLQPAAEPAHGPEPAPAWPIVPVAVPVAPVAVPVAAERPECPTNVAEAAESRLAAEHTGKLQRQRVEGRRGVQRSERARVRGKAVPLGGEPPPWARP